MRILGPQQLKARVERLRAVGVTFPQIYPPRNLPPTSEWFRSILGQIEVVELAAASHPPDRIVVEPPKEHGDVDVLIAVSPKYRLQVKEWIPVNIRTPGRIIPISEMTTSTRLDALRRFAGGRKVGAALHRIRIHPDTQHGVAYSGTSQAVGSTENVQMTVLEIASQLTNAIAENKLRDSLCKVFRQLKGYDDAILVAVINLARYPHDQAHLFKHAKWLFERNRAWRGLGGVLFVTASHHIEEATSGLYLQNVRFVGVANPNAMPSRRLDPYAFNPRMDAELLYEESTAILSTHPEGVPLRFRRREIWIRDSYFGTLPPFIGQPLAVRLPKVALERSRLAGYALDESGPH